MIKWIQNLKDMLGCHKLWIEMTWNDLNFESLSDVKCSRQNWSKQCPLTRVVFHPVSYSTERLTDKLHTFIVLGISNFSLSLSEEASVHYKQPYYGWQLKLLILVSLHTPITENIITWACLYLWSANHITILVWRSWHQHLGRRTVKTVRVTRQPRAAHMRSDATSIPATCTSCAWDTEFIWWLKQTLTLN